MTSKSIVIVDPRSTSGVGLRNSLTRAGDTAHVFSNFPSALKMVERKKVDAVVVDFDTDKETVTFCDAVRSLGVAVVYSSSHVPPSILAPETAEHDARTLYRRLFE